MIRCAQGKTLACLVLLALGIVGCGGETKQGPSLKDELEKARMERADDSRARKLVDVALKLKRAGDALTAQEAVRGAADAAKAIADADEKARALNYVARGQAQIGRIDEAKELLKDVEKILDEVKDAKLKVLVAARMAEIHGVDLEAPEVGKIYLKNALGLADKLGAEQSDAQVECLLAIAQSYQKMQDEKQAESLTDRALGVARSLADARKKADAIAAVGGALNAMKQTEKAKPLFDEAATAAGEIAEPNNRSECLISMGDLLIRTGHKPLAGPLLDKAEQAAKKSDPSFRSGLEERINRLRAQL